MKKLISLLAVLAIVLSLCACGGDPATTDTSAATEASTEATTPAVQTPVPGGALTPEQMYGHINQLEPVDGVYKIWNEIGVQNMADHPEAKFELLCNVDMNGATVRPIGTAEKPFTGEIKGANFSISNFTLQGGEEESFGFVTVNKGNIHNFLIQNVTFVPGANAKNIGALAGDNQGEINRCTVSGTLSVETAAEGASCGSTVGVNTGKLANTIVTVDLNVTAPGAANVGGIVGTANGGTIEFIDTNGKLDVTGSNKTVGLFAGSATEVVLNGCAFVGASNTVDGVMFTNFTGTQDNEATTAPNAKWRDNAAIEPLPEKIQTVRNKVVQAMNDLGTVEWSVKKDLVHSCTCQLTSCHGIYNSNYTYYGVPYNHKCSSLARFQYCQNEDGSLADWFYDLESYDGFDIYIGSDCSSSVQQSWWKVSNSTDFWNTRYIPEVYGRGTIAVGDYVCDFELSGTTKWTNQYIDATDEQVMYESYAAMRPGDAIVSQVEAGGHTRMVASDPVIVRNMDGTINPDYSYVLTTEQGAPSNLDEINKTFTSWRVNYKYTFANIYFDWYIPVTCEELLTGELEPVECQLLDGCEGYSGMFTGLVQANYHVDSVTLTITDSKGQTILDQPMFTTVQKTRDFGGNYYSARVYTDHFDMGDFAVMLANVQFQPGETYSYTVIANLATYDNIVVKESSFVYGSVA